MCYSQVGYICIRLSQENTCIEEVPTNLFILKCYPNITSNLKTQFLRKIICAELEKKLAIRFNMDPESDT